MSSLQIPLDFPAVHGKDVVAQFDGGDVTSDAGVLLLRELDDRLGLTQAIAGNIKDKRQQSKVVHPLEEMIRTRLYAIAQGYPDCNDMDTLRFDPGLLVSCGVLPSERALPSQPTLFRFDNMPTAKELRNMRVDLARAIMQDVPEETRRVIIEVDGTDTACHGTQQLSLFNGYYKKHCYVPVLVHLVEPDGRRRLLMVVLRPGNAGSAKGVTGILREVLKLVRERLGNRVQILVRADSGFGNARVIDFLTGAKVLFVLGLPSNDVVTRLAERAHLRAATQYWFYGNGLRVFDSFKYAAKTWGREHRVVVKVEITQGELNPRYVVTNIRLLQPETIYDFYCQRGDQENGIKEFKLDLAGDTTSCHRFLANQFRMFLHTAAHALTDGLRGLLKGTPWEKLQIGTLRLRLLKVAARVAETHRKVWFHLPSSYPHRAYWHHVMEQIRALKLEGSGSPVCAATK
jgi:hypothetical protein